METQTVDISKIKVRYISKDLAKDLIITNHYTHQCSQATISIGIFYKNETDNQFFDPGEKLIGAIIYNTPVGRDVWKSISPNLKTGQVFELTRLWIEDGYGKNIESYCISQSFNWLRKNEPNIKCLISYADPSENHLGIIYQATNWLYQKMGNSDDSFHKSLFYYSFDECKTWIHQKTIFDKYQAGSLSKLKELLPKPFWVKNISKKHRYIYILTELKKEKREILKTLKHPILSYPKKIDDNLSSINIVKYI